MTGSEILGQHLLSDSLTASTVDPRLLAEVARSTTFLSEAPVGRLTPTSELVRTYRRRIARAQRVGHSVDGDETLLVSLEATTDESLMLFAYRAGQADYVLFVEVDPPRLIGCLVKPLV